MQKVSKQSLAMLALSILLAISIALTFTFAALQDKKTATGIITFEGSASIAWNLNGSNNASMDGQNLKIELDNSDFDFTYEGNATKATLKSAVYTDLSNITLTISNDSSGISPPAAMPSIARR